MANEVLVEDLITDRTNEDVKEVMSLTAKGWDNLTSAEQTKWLSGLKGSYNYTDLNRVATFVKQLYELLVSSGYGISMTIKNDWTIDDVPTLDQLELYLDNVKTLRTYVSSSYSLPALPSTIQGLTYDGANNIEKNLELISIYLTSTIDVLLHSNQILFYSGYAVYIRKQQPTYSSFITQDGDFFIDRDSEKFCVKDEYE